MDKSINIIPSLKEPKAYILWLDPLIGRWLRQEISRDDYRKLAYSPIPQKPILFLGSDKEWQETWTAGPEKAKAIDGSPFDRDTKFGNVYLKEDGSLILFLGDVDNDGCLRMEKGDYSGEPEKLTVISEIPIEGVTIEEGIIKGF